MTLPLWIQFNIEACGLSTQLQSLIETNDSKALERLFRPRTTNLDTGHLGYSGIYGSLSALLSAKITESKDNPPTLSLNRVNWRHGSRLDRKIKPESCLHISGKISAALGEKLIMAPCSVEILGHKYSFLCAKQGKKSNEISLIFICEQDARMTCDEIREWHIPNEFNNTMALSKWCSRFQLMLSSTTPFEIKDPVAHISIGNDICARNDSKALLTDGISPGPEWLFRQVQTSLGFSRTPFVLQFRLGSAKGCLYLDKKQPNICLVPSQVKYHYSNDPKTWAFPCCGPIDFELCNYSRDSGPGHLNQESIMALEAQGVPFEALVSLLQEEEDDIAGLPFLDAHQLMRKYRYLRDDPFNSDASKLYHMLDAGFDIDHPIVRFFIKALQEGEVTFLKEKHNITVKKSRHLMAVADPTRTLPPNCIYCSITGYEGSQADLPIGELSGPVLISRSPLNVPQDMKIFQATSNEELKALGAMDCVIFSTHADCHCSPISELSGGDYDGDAVFISWDTRLLEHFAPCPNHHPAGDIPLEPTFTAMIKEFQHSQAMCVWLQAIERSDLGRIAFYQYCVADEKGFGHPDSLQLGFWRSKAVDAPKQGYRIPKITMKDVRPPDWYNRIHDKSTSQARVSDSYNGRVANYLKAIDPETFTSPKFPEIPFGQQDPDTALDLFVPDPAIRQVLECEVRTILSEINHKFARAIDAKADPKVKSDISTELNQRILQLMDSKSPKGPACWDLGWDMAVGAALLTVNEKMCAQRQKLQKAVWLAFPELLCAVKAYGVVRRMQQSSAYTGNILRVPFMRIPRHLQTRKLAPARPPRSSTTITSPTTTTVTSSPTAITPTPSVDSGVNSTTSAESSPTTLQRSTHEIQTQPPQSAPAAQNSLPNTIPTPNVESVTPTQQATQNANPSAHASVVTFRPEATTQQLPQNM
ncbi:rna-dependent rna polymerase 1 [Pelomyxa schiedti]|nr:rna-dependent rna polymerase 1 [Pelomyxa schiedti]